MKTIINKEFSSKRTDKLSNKPVFDPVHNENHFDDPISQSIHGEFKKQNRKRKFCMRLTLFLIILNLALIFHSFSQVITVNNLPITNTALISVNGDFKSNSGTTISNNGTIELTGNFTNDSGSGLFGTSEGTVILNGSNQSLGGNSITDFNNLFLQTNGNTMLQNDIKTGGNNLNNTGVLSLGSGTLLLNSKQLIVNNTNATAISRTTGFIVSETNSITGYSPVKWIIKNNTGNYIFPMGNNSSGHYLPVIFEINTPGVSANGYISVATYPTPTNISPNNRPLPTGLTSLKNIAGLENASNVLDRWWVLDVGGYSIKPVSSITFTYRDSEWNTSSASTNTINENTLQAQSNNYILWTPATTGTVSTINNTVTVTNVNLYNPIWTLVSNNNPLPVELLAFNAKLTAVRTVDLNWATASELNNDYFTVEKSADGINFESIESIDGAGNSTNVLYYSTIDHNPFKNISYYRLKQTDFDGQFSYSSIKAVRLDENKNESSFTVFPNPASDFIFIRLKKQILPFQFLLTDMQGKIVKSVDVSDSGNDQSETIRLDCSSFAPGIYFISAPGIGTEKLVIK